MKQLTRHIAFGVVVLLNTILCTAQVTSGKSYNREVFHLNYKINSSEILYEQEDNKIELTRLDSFIHSVMAHPDQKIERIRLTGYSSVEGYYFSNELLSRRRTYGVLDYLQHHFPVLSHYRCDVAWVAEDWEGLSRLVESSQMHERSEVLEIIRSVPIFNGRESRLLALNRGNAYRGMSEFMFPQLRRVELEVEYSAPCQPCPDTYSERIDTPIVEIPAASVKESSTEWPIQNEITITDKTDQDQQEQRRSFALKTNLSAWAGIMPNFKQTIGIANVELEYRIAPCWSVGVGVMYSYWKYNGGVEFQGISGYRIEPRWWLPLSPGSIDIYLGGYVRLGDYDLRLIKDTPGNYTGRYNDVGLSTGIFLYLSPAWGVEMGVRGGYVNSNSKVYAHRDNGNWLDHRARYARLRLTDLNLSLVYRL